MTWVCLDCGNMKNFSGTCKFEAYMTGDFDVEFDENGNEKDFEILDERIKERGDVEQHIEMCGSCSSESIEEVLDKNHALKLIEKENPELFKKIISEEI